MDVPALEGWMDRQGIGAGPVHDLVPIGGGTQNILLRFRRGTDSFVLRRPPQHPRPESNETMRREARVLAALAGSDVPHPALVGACGDETVIGVAFYLMEPVEGFNPVLGLPSLHAGSADIRRDMGFAMVDAIVALGGVDYRETGLGDFGKPDGYLQRQVARWGRQLESYAGFAGWSNRLPGVAAVAAWLEANRPADSRAGILHGDYHLANVMFRNDGPGLAAIVDWELATIGDPLIDLGWLLVTWPEADADSPVKIAPWDGFPTAADLLHRYRERGDRDVAAIDWYKVLACYKLGILLEGTHARAAAGKAPADVGQRLHARAIRLFERAGQWIQ